MDDEQRREEWEETINRYVSFFTERNQIDDTVAEELYNAIFEQKVMPSMRCMMTAGAALKRDNVAAFNCSYLPIDSPRSFDELMYILMCGTGVGFSVEREGSALSGTTLISSLWLLTASMTRRQPLWCPTVR
jgi:ribonucleoside-diphosphate reductase alpha chain